MVSASKYYLNNQYTYQFAIKVWLDSINLQRTFVYKGLITKVMCIVGLISHHNLL